VSETREVTSNSGEYLEWIYRLSREKEEVSASDLARALKVSPASVTGMLRRLAEHDLIVYQPYHGIELTESGRQHAARVIRRHGLLERLLTDVLGLPWHKVDEEACRLEHALTGEVEERLARFLGYPTTCPHGQPIDFDMPDPSVRLTTISDGAETSVRRMGDEDPEFLEYIASLGLFPGTRLRVLRHEPFNGPLIIQVGDRQHAIGREAAAKVWVEDVAVPMAVAA
jgi:DtxR family transcriptional regulator, Mn-dependent transcriptional regulator